LEKKANQNQQDQQKKLDEEKRLILLQERKVRADTYDVVFNIDNLQQPIVVPKKENQVAEVSKEETEKGQQSPDSESDNEGWQVDISDSLTDGNPSWNGISIGILGQYDRGKTFVLNHLSSSNFESGYIVNTKGLSVKTLQIDDKNHVLIDTAGLNSPVPLSISDESVQNFFSMKKKTEEFLQKLVFQLAGYLLIVVEGLSWPEQQLIYKCSRARKEEKKPFAEVFVIHNMKNVSNLPHLQLLFRRRCALYECPPAVDSSDSLINPDKPLADKTITEESDKLKRALKQLQTQRVSIGLKTESVDYFSDPEGNTRHVYLGKHDSDPQVTEHNNKTFQLLRTWISSIVLDNNKKQQKSLKLVTDAIEVIIPEFYVNSDGKLKEPARAEVSFVGNKIVLIGDITPKVDFSSAFSGLNNFEPKYSIEEAKDGTYLVILEVPSLDKLLILSAEAELPNHWACIVAGEILQDERNHILRSTRQFGKFSRKFEIPNSYKRAKPEQEAKHGIVVLKFRRETEEFDNIAEPKL